MTQANDGKWKSFQNGQVLYGPSGSGQNLNTDLQANIANEIDQVFTDLVGDSIVTGFVVSAGGGFSVAITAGTGYAAGQRCKTSGASSVSGLPPSTAGIKIYFQANAPWDGTLKAWPAAFNFTTGALVSGQVLLATVTTDGAGVLTVVDGRVILTGVSALVVRAGDTMTGALNIKMNTPALRLIGTEGSAKDFRVIESAGVMKIQRNDGTEAIPVWTDILVMDLGAGAAALAAAGFLRMANNKTLAWRNVAGSGDLTLTVNASDILTLTMTALQIGATPATAGAVRLPNGQAIGWRNAANSGDLTMTLDGSDVLTLTMAAMAIGATPATAGIVRLPNNQSIAWRNAANGANVTLTLNGSDVLVLSAASFSVGTTPAAAGAIRLPNNNTLAWRNAANGGDVTISINGSDVLVVSAASMSVGTTPAAAGAVRLPNNTTLSWRNAANGGDVTVSINGSDVLVVSAASMAIGTTPATAGVIRIPNNTFMEARNAGNSADRVLIGLDSSDRIQIGENISAQNIRMAGQVRCDLDTNGRLVLPVGASKFAT